MIFAGRVPRELMFEGQVSFERIFQKLVKTSKILLITGCRYIVCDPHLTLKGHYFDEWELIEGPTARMRNTNKTGSSQVGAISKAQNIQRTTIGNIWKNSFFSKTFLKIFFPKKSIFLESRTMPKNSKRDHSGSLNVFTNRKLQKKCKGLPFDRIRKFSKKSRIVPKKTKKIKRKKTFGLASTF